MLCTYSLFSYTHTPTTDIYTLSLHDALPIFYPSGTKNTADGFKPMGALMHAMLVNSGQKMSGTEANKGGKPWRSEEHTSELQSRENLVCRLLLEKKKETKQERCSTENETNIS